jgi:prepilin-type N-terminal cleavage/methylation domain-containing protein
MKNIHVTVPGCLHQSAVKGFSLVELTLAISITAILSVLIFSVWNQLTLHTSRQERRTALRSESLRITKQIGMHLHKTDNVISWNSTSIKATLPPDNDTVSYKFNGTDFEYNDKAISLIPPNTSIKHFRIENGNENQNGIPYLFTCIVTLGNSAGDTVTSSVTVLVRRTNTENSQSDFMW